MWGLILLQGLPENAHWITTNSYSLVLWNVEEGVFHSYFLQFLYLIFKKCTLTLDIVICIYN